MVYEIENSCIRIQVDSHGAEIKSVKSHDVEYMWCADSKYWGRTSPVLFPFVGSLKNKQYMHNNKSYSMTQHGFARDMEFKLMFQNEDSLKFRLESNSETFEKYPFNFALEITYILKDNELKVSWDVLNNNDCDMPFSIGAHPAFMCPVKNEKDKKGYQLVFRNSESNDSSISELLYHGIDPNSGLSISENFILKLNEGKYGITSDFFDKSALIFEGTQVNSVGIIDPDGNEYVTVVFDAPLFALWSPEKKNAPFICIEPWYGRCDSTEFIDELKDREYTNILEPSRNFHKEYTIKFN